VPSAWIALAGGSNGQMVDVIRGHLGLEAEGVVGVVGNRPVGLAEG
jgi:hypothetical protein